VALFSGGRGPSSDRRCQRADELKRLLRAPAALLVVVAALLAVPGVSWATTLLPGFQESVAFSGLTEPTAVEFSADGRVFVAEKGGLIHVFDDIADTTPSLFADLRNNVYNYWDRGLLGLALDPDFPARPYVYVLYTYDAPIGGTAPTWGPGDGYSDPCPSPPGPTSDGCVASGRLSRLTANGDVMTGPEQVLAEGWCQQYPSHSIGHLAFGADGALYASGGEGASFIFTDYGQDGNPLNPCGDPPSGVGGTQTPPTAEGGSLRSQDLKTSGDPVGLNGSVLRVDPDTGAGLPGNPLYASSDANARKIIGYGLRNPFRFTIRPGTNEVWIADVGFDKFEEIDRILDPGGSVENFGWPCYEGGHDASGNPVSLRQAGFDAGHFTICEGIYADGSAIPPWFSYGPGESVAPGDNCPNGSGVIAGLAFMPPGLGNYPATYDGALFINDYGRACIWFMRTGANGLPDPSTRALFALGTANPTEIEIGPGGDLFYVDLVGRTVRRISYTGSGNQLPTAVLNANPTYGAVPLTVNFDAAASSDPDPGDTLTYAWDFDNDGSFDDSHSSQPSYTFQQAGNKIVRLRVTDGIATSTAQVTINAGQTPPVATINTPTAGTTWKVGDVISFSGSAADQQDGALPASGLSWTLVLQHCPATCHTHTIQSFNGVASGSFVTPDHDYPSYLELRLTATDSSGLQDTKTVRLDPRTVALKFESSPSGLQLVVGSSGSTTPFSRQVIIGSNNSVTAANQSLGGISYVFSTWSDAGAQSHQIIAPVTKATYTAAFTPVPQLTFTPEADARVQEDQPTVNFGTSFLRADGGADPDVDSYLRFPVTGITGPVQTAKLRVWATSATVDGPAAYGTGNSWTETGINWNNRPALTSGANDDKGAIGAGAWIEYDVRPLVNGNGTYSFDLATASTDEIDFASREDANTSLWPQLVVSYAGGTDLSLTKTGSPNPVTAGDQLTYTLTAHNNGPWASGATLTDTLPKTVKLRSAKTGQGRCALLGKRTVECDLEQIASGDSATVTIVVRPTRKGTITNSANVRADQADTNSQNNSASAQTTVN
jgi:uncharacterized repeat protein (TIGR01451 family)